MTAAKYTPKDHYVYAHYKATTGEIFYIGKGLAKARRAYSRHGRNKHWHNIVAKHGLSVEILAYWDTNEEACEHEKFLIMCMRGCGIGIVNITDGGESLAGYKHTKETLAKMAKSIRESAQRPEVKARRSAAMKLAQSRPEVNAKRSEKMKLVWANPDKASKIINARKHANSAPVVRHNRSAAAKRVWETRNKNKLQIAAARRKTVRCVETGMLFESVTAAKLWLQAHGWPKAVHGHIASTARGERPRAYGFHWEYVSAPLIPSP